MKILEEVELKVSNKINRKVVEDLDKYINTLVESLGNLDNNDKWLVQEILTDLFIVRGWKNVD